jgi:hypothetical protein
LRRLASPLQQEFTTGETDLNSHFAQQQSAGANVSSGSKAEVKALIFDVGFTPGDLNRSTQHFILEGKDQL